MKFIIRAAIALAIGIEILGGGLASARDRKAADALAVIDSRTITVDEYRAVLAKSRGPVDASRKEALLDEMVRREVLLAVARKAGYEKDPEVMESFERLIIGKYISDHLEPKILAVTASDREVGLFYAEHRDSFSTPAQVRAALIRIAVPARASAEKKAELRVRAETARNEAMALGAGTPSLGSAAVAYSDDQASRYRGGDTGWLNAGDRNLRWGKEISDAIFALKAPGELSPIIESPEGYFIVKLMERKEAQTPPLDRVRDAVRQRLLQEKRSQVEKEFMAQLRKQVRVSVDHELMRSVPVPREQKPQAPPALP